MLGDGAGVGKGRTIAGIIYENILNKTKQLQNIMKQNNLFEESQSLEKKYKINQNKWKMYISKLTNIQNQIKLLTHEVEVFDSNFQKLEKSSHIKDLINKISLQNVEVQKRFKGLGQLNADNIVTSELRFKSKAKFSENIIELPDNYKIKLGEEIYEISNLFYLNEIAENFKAFCGQNLSCLISKSDFEDNNKKVNLIKKTIESVRNHIKSIK